MLVDQAEEELALSHLNLSRTAGVVDDLPLSGEGCGRQPPSSPHRDWSVDTIELSVAAPQSR